MNNTDLNTPAKQLQAMIVYALNGLDGLAGKVIVETVLQRRGYEVRCLGACENQYLQFTGYDYLVFVGYCPTQVDIRKFCKQNNSVLVIGHSARATLDIDWTSLHIEYPNNLAANVSKEYCGAMLAWHYFCGNRKVPKALEYIDDYEQCGHPYQESKHFEAGMQLMTPHQQETLLGIQFFAAYPSRHPARLDVIARGEKALHKKQEPKTGCKNNCERCKRVQEVQK